MRAATGEKTFRACLFHGKPGSGEAYTEYAHNRRPDDPRKALAGSGRTGASHTAGLVRGGAERDPSGAAGHQMRDFGAIAGGEHSAQIGLHALVGANRATAPDLDPGRRGDFHVGLKASGQDHHVARHSGHPVGIDRGDGDTRAQFHSVTLELFADGCGQCGVVPR